MNPTRDLTVAFLRAHPAEGARVLEQLDTAEISALWSALPGRVAAPVVARLSPRLAARSVETLADEKLVRLLRRLTTPSIAALLRHLPEVHRARLIDELPAATGMACRLLLRYPEDSVGALANTDVFIARPGDSVRDVLTRLKSLRDDVGDFLYIVNGERQLRACVRPASLLHVAGTMSIGAVDSVDVQALPAQAAPHSIRNHAGWTRFSTLPVVDRQNRLVGDLRQGALVHVLEHQPRALPESNTGTLTAFATASWTVMAGLLQSAVNVLPGSHRGKP